MKSERARYSPGERLEVTVERIVPGGFGLARGPAGVILIEAAAPGDRLEIEIGSLRGGAARGAILSILDPGDDRVEPPCPWYGRCGGCDFQHLAYDAQLAAKEAIVRDALARTGGFDWNGPIERFAAPHPFGSRARVELHTDATTGAIGFFERRSNEVVDIDHCMVSRPEIDGALRAIRSADRPLPPSVHLLGGNGEIRSSPPVAGLTGEPFWLEISGIAYKVDPSGFFQSSLDLLPQLIDHVMHGLPSRRGTAWDLYCGVGLFALQLAPHFDLVTGVEFDAKATANAVEAAHRNDITNVRFVAEDVAPWLERRRQRRAHPDLIVIDPPRSGLGPNVARLLGERLPARLTYVSCDPTTLARDLAVLLRFGLHIDDLSIFDLFPQTHHVETVARLSSR